MSWAKLDDGVTFHAKTVAAGNEAFGAWCRLITWSSGQLTDGAIPAQIALLICASADVVAKLVDVGLLDKSGDGYEIHDYLKYNPSAREVRKQRETQRNQRSIAGKASATKRQRGVNGSVEQPLNEVSTPSRPVPTRPDITTERDHARASSGEVGGKLSDAFGSLLSSADQLKLAELQPVTADELERAIAETKSKASRPNIRYALSVIESGRKQQSSTRREHDPTKGGKIGSHPGSNEFREGLFNFDEA
jgi:hypothetical protein